MNYSIIVISYAILFLGSRLLYKRYIENKYKYKIPTKKGFGVNRSLVYYDEEVIHNKKLAKAINRLFFIEIAGVFIMVSLVIYHVLSYSD